MRRLDRIIELLFTKPWAILPAKHRAIQELLEAHLNGANLFDFTEPVQDDEDSPYDLVGSTAILPIEGTILNKCSGLEAMCGAFSCEAFRANLRQASADSQVKNIILNISSGGGIITGVPETADLISSVAQSKNIYAYTNDVVASAAYWLASQTKGIFLSKSAEIGSIGVYMALLDVSAMYAQEGVKLELIKAGKYKAMGIAGSSLSDEDRALLQDSVNKSYAQFVSYVQSKRPSISSDTMQGQMFDADVAITNGLADGIVNELDSLISYLNS